LNRPATDDEDVPKVTPVMDYIARRLALRRAGWRCTRLLDLLGPTTRRIG